MPIPLYTSFGVERGSKEESFDEGHSHHWSNAVQTNSRYNAIGHVKDGLANSQCEPSADRLSQSDMA
jgi:hypothetical protein